MILQGEPFELACRGVRTEERAMDLSGEKQSWLDRWWPLLVILFGVICVLALDFWHPESSV